MRVFNYSEARQNFASLLNMALKEDVVITKKDGSRFKIIPISNTQVKSPFDVQGIKSNIKTDEILDFIRESREL
jgi:antitoxin Phd